MDGSIDWTSISFNPAKSSVKVGDIIAAACLHFRLKETDLRAKNRRRELARARQVVMFVAREMTSASLPLIGRELKLDHTSILWGVRRIAAMVAEGREGMPEHVKAVRELAASGNPKAALRMREAKSRHAQIEAIAEQEAEEAIRHSEQMAKLKRVRELADAGFLPTDREGRRM